MGSFPNGIQNVRSTNLNLLEVQAVIDSFANVPLEFLIIGPTFANF